MISQVKKTSIAGPSTGNAFGGSFKKLSKLPFIKNDNDEVNNITSDDSPGRSKSRTTPEKADAMLIEKIGEENQSLKSEYE